MIDYTSVRGGVSVLTNKAEITTSYLIIQKAQIEDGGIYSCQNGVVDPAKVKVHVLTGILFVIDATLNLLLCISLLRSYLLLYYYNPFLTYIFPFRTHTMYTFIEHLDPRIINL